MDERVADALREGPVQERPGKLAGGEDRQPAHHGDERRAQKNQRRRHHHQDHVLRHVRGQQEGVQHVQGGGEREPEGKQSRQK